MSLIVNGVTLPSNAVITCNGVALSSIVCNAVEVWKKGTLTLKEVVFNASGTFTMPANVVDNQIIVGCTGGGGGVGENTDVGIYGGNGGGRVVSTLTMTAGQTSTVIVGAGGIYKGTNKGGDGGTSSFSGASPCVGGKGGSFDGISPVNGGGRGSSARMGSSTASSCAAALTLQAGAIDKTTYLWTAKSYAGGINIQGKIVEGGGGGCYGVGSGVADTLANSGGGGYSYSGNGGSGKVVVWYYVYE